MSDYIHEVFGPGGLFASRFPGYEMREGQVLLARTVDRAMSEPAHALAEGPCGTGKTVAYCVPAIHHAHHEHKRVVIATAAINLQEQLVTKDLPMLAEVLPWDFEYALLKGKNNYLCLDRLAESEARGELHDLYDSALQQQLDRVLAWADETETGDVSELPFVPAPQVWGRVSVGSDECKGEACPFREDCFAERARAQAWEADVVVTNYHLLFAHLAVRAATGADSVLPPFDLLVLDEAHEAAEIARDFFGFSVSEHTIGRLASAAADYKNRRLADELRGEAGDFFERVLAFARTPAGGRRLRTPHFTRATELRRALATLVALAEGRAEDEFRPAKERAAARNVARNAETAAARICEFLGQTDPEKVYWIEVDQKGRARLRARPVDVSRILRAELFERTESVVAVSATLTTAGTFAFCRRELGVPEDANEVVAPTPFDFREQALLIVPEGLPDPRDPGFIDAAGEVFVQVVEHCEGRTLGLFTSYRNLNAIHQRLDGCRHRVLRQGELPRTELARLFKQDVGSVLLGTDSFWTGIDVPGEALTAVVIDKLPFPPPDDPVIEAICERDPQAFNNYLVPKAIIALRQGVGRLIRTRSDIGVVVILDTRIASKAYGRKFIRSLPPMLSSRHVENIPRFLSEAADAHAC